MLPFKSFIQLDERVVIAKDMDMTLGHGNARVQLKHPTENRVMTNSEVMNEIPSQHLDSSLHQERTSSPHSPFRFTDQEFNTVVGKKPEYNKNNRWDFSEHQAAEGMEGFEFFPKAVRGLKKISSMAPEKVKSIIMTARSDLVSKTPGKTPQDIISSAFHKKTGIKVSPSTQQYTHIVRTGNPEWDVAPGVKGTPHARKEKALSHILTQAESEGKPFNKVIFADDNIGMVDTCKNIANKHKIPVTFYHAQPQKDEHGHVTDVSFKRYHFKPGQ